MDAKPHLRLSHNNCCAYWQQQSLAVNSPGDRGTETFLYHSYCYYQQKNSWVSMRQVFLEVECPVCRQPIESKHSRENSDHVGLPQHITHSTLPCPSLIPARPTPDTKDAAPISSALRRSHSAKFRFFQLQHARLKGNGDERAELGAK